MPGDNMDLMDEWLEEHYGDGYHLDDPPDDSPEQILPVSRPPEQILPVSRDAIWQQADGTRCAIKSMSLNHLMNTSRFLTRRIRDLLSGAGCMAIFIPPATRETIRQLNAFRQRMRLEMAHIIQPGTTDSLPSARTRGLPPLVSLVETYGELECLVEQFMGEVAANVAEYEAKIDEPTMEYRVDGISPWKCDSCY